jgi:hypothetical protein
VNTGVVRVTAHRGNYLLLKSTQEQLREEINEAVKKAGEGPEAPLTEVRPCYASQIAMCWCGWQGPASVLVDTNVHYYIVHILANEPVPVKYDWKIACRFRSL